jgi:chemotaxis methyl-accepting protein methylase
VNQQLKLLAELLERETGIQMGEPQMAGLAAALARISPKMDAGQALAGLNDPIGGPALRSDLIDQIMVQETFFMREPRELEAIDWQHLRAAATARGAEKVAVWVPACASGEEAYSLAMLASEAFGTDRPPISILATDISARAIRRAQEAAYSERSTRELSEARRKRWLLDEGARSVVGEQLRLLVRLQRHNLVADPAPPIGEDRFDLILCRNVLIYFGTETVERVVSSLESALRPGGQLILGASDRLSSSAQRLAEIAMRHSATATAGRPPEPRQAITGSAGRALRRPLGRSARTAVELTGEAPPGDPLDAEAHFLRGLSELANDDPATAIASLRRALYIDPTFGLAAFQLGCAYDRRNDRQAARRAFSWALRTLDPEDDRHQALLEQIEVGEVAAACRARLAQDE